MGKGAGYAKAILFGEHFVVYGLPAIGLGLSKKIEVEISKSAHTTMESSHVDANLIRGLEAVKSAMKITGELRIRVKSEIPVASGLGSSAAVAVAFARALSEEYSLKLSEDAISSYAYEAEKVFHGSPSGLDNTLATRGGAILFQKRENGNLVTQLKIGRPLSFVIGCTGKKRKSTAEILADVKARKERNPVLFQGLFEAEKALVEQAAKALELGKAESIGELMNVNHGLLSALGVSARENEDIVQAAREMGAYGAKITGAGLGGSCIALAKSDKHAEEIAESVRKMGYVALCSTIGAAQPQP